MKTTLGLPDDLVRAVKLRALEENLTLEDMVARLLRRGLEQTSSRPAAVRSRVALPLVECDYGAEHEAEMTPDRVAEALLLPEIESGRDPLR